MTPEKLLQECEALTHNDRMHRMVEFGKLAGKEKDVAETLAELARGTVYQRLLATQACYGSRDTAQAMRVLSDPSHLVRGRALNVASLICSDAELQEALEQIPLDMKRALLYKLCNRRRRAPIDAYLAALAARNDAVLQELLSFGSREFVAGYSDEANAGMNLATLRRIARRYPDLVAGQLRTQAAASKVLDPQLVGQMNNVLPLLAKNAPDLALDLVKTLRVHVPLAHLHLQPLVRKRPHELVDLLLETNEQSTLRFDMAAHQLSTERLLALFTRYPGTISTRYFEKLRPQQRLALYTACERGWRNADGVLALYIVAALPAEQRVREGRRHLELPALVTRPLERFPYAAFLPWDEARALLDTPLRSPDASLRGAALQALIGATRYQREHLADALQLVRQHRYEQDPVRNTMLLALALLPHGIWQTVHLDDLAQIIRDALNATDLSYSSTQSLVRLIAQSFPFHAEWSAQQMATVYRERRHIGFFSLEIYLSNADIRALAPVLMPILRSWQNREQEGLLIVLANALGRRLRVFTELADLLETMLDQTHNSYIADSILRLFLEHQRGRVHLLIPRLLRKDKSAITLSSVHTYLHRWRQDLLTPFLGQHTYKGRFSTGRTRFVLPLEDGFFRWTPQQQEIFTRTLLEVVHEKDQHRATSEWLVTIRRIAAMTAIDFTPLIELANDERPPVREATLRALGRLDAGQGIPTLLEALDDERARIAIYALRGALLTLPPAEALELLRKAPLAQVTVAKEVVRLIGELAFEEAYRELLTWETRELHRDVRVALLRALWDYPEHAETWEIFTRAAQSSDVALARGVVHIPLDGLPSQVQPRLAALTAILLAHPEPEVRMATLQWRSQYPLTDHEQFLFTRLVTLMNSQLMDECVLAAKIIFSIYTGNEATLIGEAVRGMLDNRRALQTVCTTLASALPTQINHLLPTTRAILAALTQDRLTLTLRVELIVNGLPWEEIAPELTRLAEQLHSDALQRAVLAISQASTRPDARLIELEIALAASTDERLRRLALSALVAQSRQADGWSDAAIARLEQYRRDPSSLVAEAAQFTFVA